MSNRENEGPEPPPSDGKVGYGKPPGRRRFKGSGNLKGRPKSKKSGSVDVAAILDAPVKVRTGGKEQYMSPFEASLRQLAKKAFAGYLPAILKYVRICEEYDEMKLPPVATKGGVYVAPKGVTPEEWIKSGAEEVPVDEE